MEAPDPEEVVATPEELAAEKANFLKSGISVLYCGVCGLPAEYCEYGPKFNQCKPWLVANCPELYPGLKEAMEQKAAKKQQKKTAPKCRFIAWIEILPFHYIRQQHTEQRDAVTYRGKIKLHGTNAGVTVQHGGAAVSAQSRNTFVTPKQDHHGFAAFVKSHSTYFTSLYQPGGGYENLVIFGEWCGRGIMRGAAICTLEKRIFGVFAVLFDTRVMFDPDRISHFLSRGGQVNVSEDVVVLPYITPELSFVFADPAQLQKPVETLKALVNEVDKEDPWVLSKFNIRGTGEGIVWYPVSLCDSEGRMDYRTFEAYVFKTKGPSHSVAKQAAAQVTVEKIDTAEQFVDMFATEARFEQGLQEALKEELDSNKVGIFTTWVANDVKKESVAELRASGLPWDALSDLIKVRAHKWYIEHVMKKCIST